MKKYMKNMFEFWGIKKPERNEIQKKFLEEISKGDHIDWDLIFFLWNLEEREYQYFAIDILDKMKNKLVEKDISNIEKLILIKPWWDTVDLLATKIVGQICSVYPRIIKNEIMKWKSSDNIWLVRSAILFQLKYKENTNCVLLEKIIVENKDTGEFFIDKSIGWILRQYSKTNPEWVREFIGRTEISKLSIREASKYL